MQMLIFSGSVQKKATPASQHWFAICIIIKCGSTTAKKATYSLILRGSRSLTINNYRYLKVEWLNDPDPVWELEVFLLPRQGKVEDSDDGAEGRHHVQEEDQPGPAET